MGKLKKIVKSDAFKIVVLVILCSMEGEPVSDKFEIEGIDINRYRVKVKGKKVYISR